MKARRWARRTASRHVETADSRPTMKTFWCRPLLFGSGKAVGHLEFDG